MAQLGQKGEMDEETVQEAFEMFDHDNNGTITMSELTKVLQVLGFNPTEKDIELLIKKNDKDGNKSLEFEEFKTLMMSYKAENKDEKEKLMNAFRMFDKDGNGFIEAKELKQILHGFGQTISDTEIDDMIGVVDVDNDGRINYKGQRKHSKEHAEFVKNLECGSVAE